MTTQRPSRRPRRHGFAPFVAVLAPATLLALGAWASGCGGDDTPITFIGVVDASPPRLGIVASDAGTEDVTDIDRSTP